jgi:predicted branched-subunit amino acid permease
LHLEFVIPLYLVGQTLPKLAGAATRRAALTAAAIAALALATPMHLGITIGIAAGIATGLVRPAHKQPSSGRAPR